jgi:hypothetical protein
VGLAREHEERVAFEHKYKDRELTEKEWKENLKKDGLTF